MRARGQLPPRQRRLGRGDGAGSAGLCGDGTGKKRTRAEGEALGAAMLAEFDRVCGLEHLRVLHLNDSLGARGSCRDRHAHIGKGNVALGAFAAVVRHPKLAGAPKIMETPKENDAKGRPMDEVNLGVLRKLRGS